MRLWYVQGTWDGQSLPLGNPYQLPNAYGTYQADTSIIDFQASCNAY